MLTASADATPGLMALLAMPLLIELIMKGTKQRGILQGAMLLLWAGVAESELSALAWLPDLLVLAWMYRDGPTPLPPERIVPKQGKMGPLNWFWRNIPFAKPRWLDNPAAVTRLGIGGISRSRPFTYQSHSPSTARNAGRQRGRRMAKSLRLILITCLSASAIQTTTAFDSDSKQIAIDNCSSRCLTNSRRDFLPGTIQKCNIAVMGVGGSIKCRIKGTVSWTVEDDQGRPHDIIIPDVPMSAELPHRLLSPQHWAQETERTSRIPLLGSWRPSCSTNAAETTLTWGRGKFTKTVPLDPAKNVAVMSTKAGIKKYTAFAAKVEALEPQVCCFVAAGTPAPTPPPRSCRSPLLRQAQGNGPTG